MMLMGAYSVFSSSPRLVDDMLDVDFALSLLKTDRERSIFMDRIFREDTLDEIGKKNGLSKQMILILEGRILRTLSGILLNPKVMHSFIRQKSSPLRPRGQQLKEAIAKGICPEKAEGYRPKLTHAESLVIRLEKRRLKEFQAMARRTLRILKAEDKALAVVKRRREREARKAALKALIDPAVIERRRFRREKVERNRKRRESEARIAMLMEGMRVNTAVQKTIRENREALGIYEAQGGQ